MSEAGSVTAAEYLERQESLERDARDLMPYNFDTCTFDLGPLRQPVYACRTCQPQKEGGQRGGMCYSCSISCHGDHELVELFTKRDFVCDCGTERIPKSCTLRGDRTRVEATKDNSYNHNFESRFCDCDQMYDPATEEGTMVQCLLGTSCGEDWFHERCIGKTSSGEIADEKLFICWKCTNAVPWLKRYIGRPGIVGVTHQEHTVESLKRKVNSLGEPSPKKIKLDQILEESSATKDQSKQENVEENGLKAVSVNEQDRSQSSTECKLEGLLMGPNDETSLFLDDNFREELCDCAGCQERMPPILIDDIPTYEPPVDEDDVASIHDAGSAALNSLPREQAIDGIMAYRRMKERLTAFLRPYAEGGKVVSEGDVKRYFDQAREEDRAAAR